MDNELSMYFESWMKGSFNYYMDIEGDLFDFDNLKEISIKPIEENPIFTREWLEKMKLEFEEDINKVYTTDDFYAEHDESKVEIDSPSDLASGEENKRS